jgi:ribosomal silencing factor RsfS
LEKAESGELKSVGDPVELAMRYNEQGADEMVFYDITASAHERGTMVDVIERVAERCFHPLTVGAVSAAWRICTDFSMLVRIKSASILPPWRIRFDPGVQKSLVLSVLWFRLMLNGWLRVSGSIYPWRP